MKLSVTLISGGRYYRAGQDVPDDRVPPAYAKYAVTETDEMLLIVKTHQLQNTRMARKWGAQ